MTLPTTQTNGAVPALSDEDIALMAGATPTADFKPDDLLIPYLLIVQPTSGFVQRNDPDFIESAHAGDIIDTLTREPRQRVAFVPVKFKVTYSEWKPNRGPLVKMWDTDGSKYDTSGTEFGTRRTSDGNDIVPNATYFGLIIFEDRATMPVTLNMTGTQYKKSRRLNSLIDMLEVTRPDGSKFTPPMYSRVYAMSTVSESNDLGSWNGWRIDPGSMLLQVEGGREVFLKAQKLREDIDAGRARAAPTTETVQRTMDTDARGEGGVPRPQDRPAAASHPDDQIPF